jgi:hypothetical protein
LEKKGRPSFIALPLPRKFLSRSRPTTPGDGSSNVKEPKEKEGKEGKKRFRRSWSGAGSTPLEEGTPGKGKGKGKEKEEKRLEEKEEKTGKGRRRPKPQRAFSLGMDVGGGPGAGRENDIVGIVMSTLSLHIRANYG